MKKWDYKFLDLAGFVSKWSRDPSTKVGSVITDNDNRIVSIGYNGFPKGIKDDGRLKDRNLKYDMIVHAEVNALLFANTSVEGCTIYTWPFMPCSRCAALVIQSGIKKVVSVKNKDNRWDENFELSKKMFLESGVKLEIIS